ncbi:MAG TPA: DegT/DnrJ/EryC1/StrS family aminotransferase [Ignavibacteriales bacterium]|nr:DegT/DnrJ/EryC1/StrS family aminotransferase [Ignavibacteriales bacterium]HOL81085.1 DegT/DnrJ/EryC1/StrS family aminotransferase [Ignavibacteriales bacterium]HOM65645.1 DegT/DnrJ/EryC1/StrS family aminotransferase [Ignavibacteriales bacterium]HPP32866.1 DegT/DnrJ/EryC1/StrS family aminotransferase [Ignavibacteriales bacterium]
MKIPLMDISCEKSILNEIQEKIYSIILRNDFINGKEIELFENNFAKFVNNNYCVSCSNGTDALILALKTLNITNNDKVIVPVNTFIATAEAVTAVGAKIVFVDSQPDSLEINYQQIADILENDTKKEIKAIIPVHLYGHMNNIFLIQEIAKKFNIKVIEDSSQAHGAKYKNISPGELSDIATYSFYPGKNLGAFGDAGALTTNNYDYYIKAKMLRNHGRYNKKYEHEIEGYNMRLDTIQAAILDVKLKYLSQYNQMRKQKAALYNSLLENTGDLILPIFDNDIYQDVWYIYTIRTKFRDKLQNYLLENNIQTGIYYPIPLHLQKAYRYLNYDKGKFPKAEKIANEILALPLWPFIQDDTIYYICQKIKEFY